jgi:hypothetical protein
MARLSHTTRPFVLSAGTLPEVEWRKIAAVLSGWRKRMRSSAKGMPQMLHSDPGPEAPGRKILVADEESVAVRWHGLPSAIVIPTLPCH